MPGPTGPECVIGSGPRENLSMARRRFSREEIIQHLRTAGIEQGTGATQEEAARKVGVALTPQSRWESEFGGCRVNRATRPKEHEQESSRFRQIVSDQALKI